MRARGLVLPLAVLTVLSSAGFVGVVSAPQTWTIEEFDQSPEGYQNYGTSVAVDSRGVPHIAYVLRGPYDLKYATRTPTGWDLEFIKSWIGSFVQLKLDSRDEPHIAFYGSNRELGYAHKSGGTWSVQAPDPEYDCGIMAGLALDSKDVPHFVGVCEHGGEWQLRYTLWDGAKWVGRVVDRGVYSAAIALDGSDRPHLAYFNVSRLELRHAHYNGATWQTEVVDTGVNIGGRGTSVAVDKLGRVHVSYMDEDAGFLKYAVRAVGGGWTVEVVARPITKFCGGNRENSLALDSKGNARIVYFICLGNERGLGYAWKDATWSTEVVDGLFSVGALASLAIDGRDRPHASYVHINTGRIRYAGVLTALPPTAVVSVSPSPPGFVGMTFVFDGRASSDSDGTIASWSWDFGDGTIATGPVVTHAYSQRGAFVASLTVTDDSGLSGQANVSILVANRVPTANGGLDVTTFRNQVVTLDGSGSADPDGDPLTFAWTQTAGPPVTLAGSATATPRFTASLTRTYAFSLVVSDGEASSAPDAVSVFVTPVPPAAVLDVDQTTSELGHSFIAHGNRSRDPDGSVRSYRFSWGDGSETGWQDASSASHAYATPGTYTATLWVTDDEGLVSAPVSVRVTVQAQAGLRPADVSWLVILFLLVVLLTLAATFVVRRRRNVDRN